MTKLLGHNTNLSLYNGNEKSVNLPYAVICYKVRILKGAVSQLLSISVCGFSYLKVSAAMKNQTFMV